MRTKLIKTNAKTPEYDIKELFLLTTTRKIRANLEGTRYVTECFIGVRRRDLYYDFFSDTYIKEQDETGAYPEFNRPYITIIEPLSKHSDKKALDKKAISHLLNTINKFKRSVISILDDGRYECEV